VQRIAVAAKLKPGSAERAAQLLSGRPPFDPRAAGFEHHRVFLAEEEVIFVFEGALLEPLVKLLSEAVDASVLGAWDEILDGMPRVAHEVYSWDRPPDPLAPGWE
jgi:hypothetical protein